MGLLDKGPGYTAEDLVYWAGLIGGTAAGYGLLSHLLELHPLARLIGALVCGVAVGYLCETIFRRARKAKGPDGDEPPPPGT
jgi:hypothetical protein